MNTRSRCFSPANAVFRTTRRRTAPLVAGAITFAAIALAAAPLRPLSERDAARADDPFYGSDVIFTAVGDVTLGGAYSTVSGQRQARYEETLAEVARTGGAGAAAVYPFELVRKYLSASDIAAANLECTHTKRSEQRVIPGKKHYLRGEPSAVDSLSGNFDVVSLANNHVMDYGDAGLADTTAALDAAGVLHAGAGENSRAARRGFVFRRRGIRVGFYAFSSTRSRGLPPGRTAPVPPGLRTNRPPRTSRRSNAT
jgi:hypothetical protein